MQNMNSQNILRHLAKQMRSKVSRCEHFDPNICSYEPDATNIARVITQSGQPFLSKTSFIRDGQKIRLHANDDVLQISLPFEFGVDPLSINRKDQIYFLEVAGELKAGNQKYQAFSRKGILTENQKALVQRPALKRLVANVHPNEYESLHFYGNGLVIYLFRPTADRTTHIIDCAVEFSTQVAHERMLTNAKVDISGLPPQFRPLLSLVQAWGITDDIEREERRRGVPRAALQAVVAEVRPYLLAINSYLDSFGHRPLSDSAIALGALAEFAVETDLYLNETRNHTSEF
jgi:hypothetical protein